MGIDVQCLLVFYQLGKGHLGISTDDLKAIANTYLRVMTGPAGILTNRMDGSNRGRKKTKGHILRAIGLTLVEPKIFDACAKEVLEGIDLRPGVSFAEFLYWRQFRSNL